jgi:hypothetical protein
MAVENVPDEPPSVPQWHQVNRMYLLWDKATQMNAEEIEINCAVLRAC